MTTELPKPKNPLSRREVLLLRSLVWMLRLAAIVVVASLWHPDSWWKPIAAVAVGLCVLAGAQFFNHLIDKDIANRT